MLSESRRRILDPLIVAVLATTISLTGAARPSFWYDEAATISAAYSRSLGQLWQMLGNVDAVHGLYYLLMHGWFRLAPPTEFWSRARVAWQWAWRRPEWWCWATNSLLALWESSPGCSVRCCHA